ncbi:MAG: hypothetical protein AAF557_16515 [Pseudomonadota bacterium]
MNSVAKNRPLRILIWIILILVALVVPVYAIGFEWRHTANCAPDPPQAAFDQTRIIALATWGATLITVGAVTWTSLRMLAIAGGGIWPMFGFWKATSLGLGLVATPSCFESYAYLADRMHSLEEPLAWLTLICWVALLLAIVLRALTVTPFPDKD